MLLRPLLPPCVLVAEIDPRGVDPRRLRVAERRQVECAVEARQKQYGAGRLLAHELMERLGTMPADLLDGDNGAPDWPPGLVGSITHCNTLCSVAVALSADMSALGIDVEEATPLNSCAEGLVLDVGDRAAMADLPDELRSIAGKLVFSAKESVYKALYPSIRRFLDFKDVVIRDIGGGTFTPVIRYPQPGDSDLARLEGRYRTQGALLATAVMIEP